MYITIHRAYHHSGSYPWPCGFTGSLPDSVWRAPKGLTEVDKRSFVLGPLVGDHENPTYVIRVYSGKDVTRPRACVRASQRGSRSLPGMCRRPRPARSRFKLSVLVAGKTRHFRRKVGKREGVSNRCSTSKSSKYVAHIPWVQDSSKAHFRFPLATV